MVQSVDLFPTLCELAELPSPTFTNGVSIAPMLTTSNLPGRPAVSYFRDKSTIRTETHRLILHRDGFAELYDHTVDDGETKNVADQFPEIVQSLREQLSELRPVGTQS